MQGIVGGVELHIIAPEVVAAAQERGRSRVLETTVAELLVGLQG